MLYKKMFIPPHCILQCELVYLELYVEHLLFVLNLLKHPNGLLDDDQRFQDVEHPSNDDQVACIKLVKV